MTEKTVKQIRFNLKSPQLWHDDWRGADRVCRFYGECIVCGRRCYGFDDGENDPRGVLGDHAVSMFHASDYDAEGPDVVACFACQNDYDRYNYGLKMARRSWTNGLATACRHVHEPGPRIVVLGPGEYENVKENAPRHRAAARG